MKLFSEEMSANGIEVTHESLAFQYVVYSLETQTFAFLSNDFNHPDPFFDSTLFCPQITKIRCYF